MKKKVTDLQTAKFVGVTAQALRNWKKPQTTPDRIKYYLPTGKHNLYRGARLVTYLLDLPIVTDEDGNKNSLPENRLEILTSSAVELDELIRLACKNSPYKERLTKLSSTIKRIVKDMEEISLLQK